MGGVEFNPNVKNVQTSKLTFGQRIQNSFNAILNFDKKNDGMGVCLEQRSYPDLSAHFEGVPNFEYNSKQENLVIKGSLMDSQSEEFAEV